MTIDDSPSDQPIPKKLIRSHARQQFLALAEPKPQLEPDDVDRDTWIQEVCSNFVSKSRTNKQYYRVVLESLWPAGHGIPGPILSQLELRRAIDVYRLSKHQGDAEYQPYGDPFRRIRELQGEEGIIGIARVGQKSQLVHLETARKRVPRTRLNSSDWITVLEIYRGKCAVCGREEPEVSFDQDHKIPRVRGGSDELDNWQPLCGECNNFKSTACRGCELNCLTCPWAFPEKYAPLLISSDNLVRIREQALKYNMDPNSLINNIIENFIGDE